MSYTAEYKEQCPYCPAMMECDMVDVGVGMVRAGPYHCYNCEASEIGQEWTGDRLHLENAKELGLDEDEIRTGTYKGGRISPHANQINGTLVDHKIALGLYRLGILDNKPGQENG